LFGAQEKQEKLEKNILEADDDYDGEMKAAKAAKLGQKLILMQEKVLVATAEPSEVVAI